MENTIEYNDECLKLANNNQGISDDDIFADITATQREIFQYQQKLGLFYGGRLDSGYRNEVKSREEFIEKLKKILRGRELLRDGANNM